MSKENPANPTKTPRVYKEEDLALMIELIDGGLWSTTNLSNALHINRETIDIWKERKEVQEAHRKSILKWVKRRKDAEIALREMGVDTPQEAPKTLIQVNYQPIFGGKSVDALPADNSDT